MDFIVRVPCRNVAWIQRTNRNGRCLLPLPSSPTRCKQSVNKYLSKTAVWCHARRCELTAEEYKLEYILVDFSPSASVLNKVTGAA